MTVPVSIGQDARRGEWSDMTRFERVRRELRRTYAVYCEDGRVIQVRGHRADRIAHVTTVTRDGRLRARKFYGVKSVKRVA